MKKFGAFIMSLITGLACIGTGLASWIFNSRVVVNEAVGMTPVGGIIECYKVNGGKEESAPYAKFVSLEAAVNSSNNVVSSSSSNVNMYLTTGSFIETKNQNLTLNSGVSLYLPYEGKTCDISSDEEVAGLTGSFVDISETNIKKYNVSKLNFINTKLNISQGSQVYIGGKFGEKGVCDVYSEIDLDKSSNITVNGSLYCHGYIKEIDASHVDQNNRASSNLFFNSFDSNRYIEVQSGGFFSAPLVFYDAGGLGALTGLNEKGVFPIDTFDLPNVQTYLKIMSGATFKAPARLSRTSGGQTVNVRETLTIVKPSSVSGNSLLNLSNGFISFEYCPLTPGFTLRDRSKTYVVINGTADMGYLSIKVQMVEISTKDRFLPFSYKYQLIGGPQCYFSTGTYKIKFLAGSMLKILKGGTFNNQSEIIAYRSNSLQGLSDYPSDCGDSKIVINGTFRMTDKGKIGGHISTEQGDETAQLDFTNTPKDNLNVSSTEGLSQTIVRLYATGDFYDSDNGAISSNLIRNNVIIKSDALGKKCWADGGNIVSYVLSIVVNNIKNYANPLAGYKVYKYDGSNNKTLLSTDGVYMVSSNEYLLEKGESFEIESLDRAEDTAFTKQTNTQYTFTNNAKYLIKSDVEVTITPGEGILAKFSIDSESGASGSSVIISEAYTKGGTYYQIGQGSGGNAVSLAVKKNAYVKYEVTQGPCRKKLEDHYIIKGIVNAKEEDKTNGNGKKLNTTFKNNWGFSLTGGAKSISTDTLITEESTIHAYIKN